MAYCRQWLRVRVNNRFVDLRIMSSTSVELKTNTETHREKGHKISDRAAASSSTPCGLAPSESQHKQCKRLWQNSLVCGFLHLEKTLNVSQFKWAHHRVMSCEAHWKSKDHYRQKCGSAALWNPFISTCCMASEDFLLHWLNWTLTSECSCAVMQPLD